MPIIIAGVVVAGIIGTYVLSDRAGEALGRTIGEGTGDAIRYAAIGSIVVFGYVYIKKNG